MKFIEKIWITLAWMMPKELAKWTAVRVMTNGTTGKYSHQVVSELTCIEALQRWK